MNTVKKISLLGTLGLAWLSCSSAAVAALTVADYVRIDGGQPEIWYNDTTAGSVGYEVLSDYTVPESYAIRQTGSGQQPFLIEPGADNWLLYLSGLNLIGINTNVPAEELHITSTNPAIRLQDTTVASGYVDLDMDAHEFAIQGETGLEPVEIDTRAPTHSFSMGQSGYVGLGLLTPTAKLHVYGNGDDAAAQVLVRNVNSATPGVARKLFQIENGDGPAKFSMWAGATDEWAFNALTNAFRISKQGTGEVEMELNQNGNLTIAGLLSQGSSRAIKHDIVEVDTKKILDKVLALPVAEWTYNHDNDGTRHMGPMAEDFHQVFGLGDNDKKLTTVDTSGVALAAIQGLSKVVEEKDKEIEALRSEKDREVGALRTEIAELRTMIQGLALKDNVAMAD